MQFTIRERGIYLLSVLFGAAPFVLAFVRAVQTGHDLRLLWMALASFVGATAVVAVAKAGSRKPSVVVARSAGTFVVATLLAGSAALLLGATAAPAIWAVASVFGLCCTVSRTLDTFSRYGP